MIKRVKKDMNACEDFLELTVMGYITACAMELLGITAIDEIPTSGVIEKPEEAWMKDDRERLSTSMDVAKLIVEQHVDLSATFSESQSNILPATSDGVHAYSFETLSLGLLFMEFKDAIREGDGNRVLRVWKYFLLLFKAADRKNCY